MNKILIIEDNEDIAGLLKDILIKAGYEVIVCYDSVQGMEFMHKQVPDLILLDLMLPAGGGFYVLEKMKLSDEICDIPVVVLTASHDKELREKALKSGIAAYLEKPYEARTLLITIQNCLR